MIFSLNIQKSIQYSRHIFIYLLVISFVKLAMATNDHKCRIYDAEQVVQIVSNGEQYIRGNTDKIKNLSILSRKENDSLTIVSIG